MRSIYINNNVIKIPDKTNMYGESSKIYHVEYNSEDLAVKIFHKSLNTDFYDLLHPTEDDLDYFTLCYYPGMPVLLSKYKITDIYGNYIGSATDYITETKGDSIEQIKLLPRDLFFKYLYNIIDTVPYFTEAEIVLTDWQIDNLILGKSPYNENEQFYIIDDTDYFTQKKPNNNSEIKNLLESIIDTYLTPKDYLAGYSLIDEMKKVNDSIAYLENITSGYSNLDECFTDYAKVYKRNSF